MSGDAHMPGVRWVWALAALLAGAVLAVSRYLTPAREGFGTHTQLGLPPCGFRTLFALPCPACGLTTSFAHLAHLQISESLQAHPLGLPLFAGTLLLFAISLHGLVRGTAPTRVLARPLYARALVAWLLALLIAWLGRLLGGR